MFVRAAVILETAENTKMVPRTAIVRRSGEDGVFLISDDEETVTWTPVETGIQNATHIAVRAPDIQGKVVTLGQQLLGDGSTVRVVDTGRTHE